MGVLLLALATVTPVRAQLPFTVAIVDVRVSEKDAMRRVYQTDAREHEVLYCVETWEQRAAKDGLDFIVISAVRRAEDGSAHKVADVGEKCLAADGSSLPMIHTHSDGNCQFSPSDLVTIAARLAPFEGVQCGERHFIWAFAWQVVAIANAREAHTLASAPQR